MNVIGGDLNNSIGIIRNHNTAIISNSSGNTSITRLSISPMNRTVGERRRPSIVNATVVQNATPSPDEIIIKSRGRRSLPVKWSPIPIESPQKLLGVLNRKSPKKGLISLRSSPRKRLQLNDPSPADLLHSRKLLLSSSPLAIRSNDFVTSSPRNMSLDSTIKKLPQKDLATVLRSLLEKHPEMKDEVIQEIPNQETLLVVEKLSDLQNFILDTVSSGPENLSFSANLSKVTSNFSMMMKIIEDHCQHLSSNMRWESLKDFILTAWPFVNKTPVSNSRIQLKYLRDPHYKLLAQYSLEALQNIHFQNSEIDVDFLCYRYEQLSKDHASILSSVEYMYIVKTEKES